MKTKEERLLKWLLSEDWVIADSHTHVAVDIDDIQRSFVAHFPDAPVPDSGDVEGLLEDLINDVRGAGTRQTAHELRNWIRAFGERVEKERAHFAAKTGGQE